MSVTSGFFNSLNGDRRYNAEQMSSIFDGIINDGIFANIGTAFRVRADTENTITVGIGRAWFNSTWLLNDAVLPLTADVSEILLNRIDAVVIEINHSESVREGSIKIVKGTPASNPNSPTMIYTSEVHQYPLAYIYRAAGSSSIVQANITNMIGTGSCPYITTILQVTDIDNIMSQPEMHRMIFRGKYLGTSLSTEQKASIQDGSFKNLWLGDYWVINDVNWRIVDFDYWYNTGDTAFTKHHLVIMPDTTLLNRAMDQDASTQGGYVGSDMYRFHLDTFRTIINSAFGSAVLTHREYLTSYVDDGRPADGGWRNSNVELPNEIMIYGSPIFTPSGDGLKFVDRYTISKTQLALFTVAPKFANIRKSYWLRDVVSDAHFACVNASGFASYLIAADLLGVRPVFPIG